MDKSREEIIAEVRLALERPGLTGLLRRAAPAMLLLGLGCAYGAPNESDLELCSDGRDNNYDGRVDCDDPSCQAREVCQDCHDGVDNDADGRTDCADWSCAETELCSSCSDSTDNDADGLTDCADPECADDPACQGG